MLVFHYKMHCNYDAQNPNFKSETLNYYELAGKNGTAPWY